MSSQETEKTLCDSCDAYFYKGVVVWGKKPNPDAEKLNATLAAENKLEWCDFYERYFNKNFKKRKHHCTIEDEGKII